MKQSIRLIKGPIQSRILIPGSKSITNRALLLASLAEGASELFDILISEDTLVFAQALRQLGVAIQINKIKKSCLVTGNRKSFSNKIARIWCENSGTTARFLLAVCAATRGTYHFDGTEQLQQRPLASLVKVLTQQGADVFPDDSEKMPFALIGCEQLLGGEIEIDASETSQFLSALLMIAPFSKTSVTLKPKGKVDAQENGGHAQKSRALPTLVNNDRSYTFSHNFIDSLCNGKLNEELA